MAKSTSERVANYRVRRKAEGMVTLSLVVPAADAARFTQFAAERRKNCREGKLTTAAPREQWQAMLNALMPRLVEAGTPSPAKKTAGLRIARAENLVGAIIKHIRELGWPVDMPLGSEQELMRTHGVSRTVLRQAVRLLEHHSIARMRRGTSGGLVVTRPDLRATARAAAVYLEYAGIAPRDILTTRRILELATLDLVIDRLDDDGIRRLQAQLEAEAALDGSAGPEEFLRFHFLLGELCGDPALQLFSGVVLQLSDAHSTFHSRTPQDRDAVAARIRRFHKDITLAIAARNGDRARTRMTQYIAGMRAWLT